MKKEYQFLTFERNYSALFLPLTFYFVTPDLANADKNCLSSCKSKQGKCKFCGTEGYCCKKGSTPGNGCDGTFGGEDKHICVLKPKGKITFSFDSKSQTTNSLNL